MEQLLCLSTMIHGLSGWGKGHHGLHQEKAITTTRKKITIGETIANELKE